jgi:hypothetical protein
MGAPSKELLEGLSDRAGPKPAAVVTVEVETAPDFDALGDALRAALKGRDNKALCDAVAAITTCCDVGDGDTDDDD